ncbi:MAG: NUDIX hydrolase [Acidobacteriota bacterium]|nr:NUDIX hydrolase [Acidobacteriota bacterium]
MTKKPWQVIASSEAHRNPYFSVLEQKLAVSDGTERNHYSIAFPRPAVGVIACRGTDVLLIRQYRFIVDEYVWAIPSGGAEEGEPPEQAALRELEEETGYTAGRVEPLLNCYASYGCSDQRFEIFLANDVRATGKKFDLAEVLDVRWFRREEVLAMVTNNGIVDNLSLSPILLFLLRSGQK